MRVAEWMQFRPRGENVNFYSRSAAYKQMHIRECVDKERP